jgi:hypothetical protein
MRSAERRANSFHDRLRYEIANRAQIHKNNSSGISYDAADSTPCS